MEQDRETYTPMIRAAPDEEVFTTADLRELQQGRSTYLLPAPTTCSGMGCASCDLPLTC
jgi:hypothetical protein